MAYTGVNKGGSLDIYRERAHLIAYLASRYTSYLARPQDAEPGFTFCVYVLSPEGQLSWHIADTDLDLFVGIPEQHDAWWDGHTTDEKYERLRALTN